MSQDKVYCTNCGHNVTGHNFCTNCGTKVEIADSIISPNDNNQTCPMGTSQ